MHLWKYIFRFVSDTWWTAPSKHFVWRISRRKSARLVHFFFSICFLLSIYNCCGNKKKLMSFFPATVSHLSLRSTGGTILHENFRRTTAWCYVMKRFWIFSNFSFFFLLANLFWCKLNWEFHTRILSRLPKWCSSVVIQVGVSPVSVRCT